MSSSSQTQSFQFRTEDRRERLLLLHRQRFPYLCFVVGLDAPKDSPACIQALEMHRIAELGFGLPQEQNPSNFERIVQAREDLLLQLRVEINQNVAASKEIYMGNRGILSKIASPKDHE